MTPMRAIRLLSTLLTLSCVILAAPGASAGPTVRFQPDTISVIAGATLRTPPISITSATGVTMVNLTVALPPGVSINTTLSGGNLACVAQGSGVSGLFFSSWDSVSRRISVVCSVSAGATIEVVRSIQFSTSSDVTACAIALGGTLTGGSGTALFESLALVPVHGITVSSIAVAPTEIGSSGSANCSVSATDSLGHTMTYTWSDGGRGGSFSPSAAVQNPIYTAPSNVTGTTITVPLRCTVTCTQNSTVSASATTNLNVRTVPLRTIQISSTPNSGASVAFSPSPEGGGKTSPKTTPVSISYLETATGIVLTAAKQDGATRPLWFDHWNVDGVNKPQGQLSVTINMGGINHTAQAVYGRPVGDLNNDGRVNKADAEIILSAVQGDIPTTPDMDVNQSGAVDLQDAKWILKNRS